MVSHETNDRNFLIDFVRGLAILLVVYGHSIQSCNAMSSNNPVHVIIQTFQMPILMLISGYCSGFNEPVKNVNASFFRKVKRLLIPYIIWEQVHFFLLVALGRISYTFKGQLLSIMASDFWFLRVLFLIYCAYYSFWVLYSTLERHSKNSNISFILSFTLCFFLIFVFSRLPGCSLVGTYSICFFIGNAFYKLKVRIRNRSIIYVPFVVGSVAFVVSVILFFQIDGLFLMILDKSMAFTGSMFFVSAGYLFFSVSKRCIKQFVSFLGKRTLSIYAIHWCLLFSLNLIDYSLLVNKLGINICLAAFVVAFLWLVICLLCISISSKIKTKIFYNRMKND